MDYIVKGVMKNEEAVNLVKSVKDPQAAAKLLTTEALARKSKDDISCIIALFGLPVGGVVHGGNSYELESLEVHVCG
ncbi:hypothetical protein GOBAR_DD20682 [Gossypium barbadense]|nr:hypothetical protein GOBAR_DD20682 [Gossypium barbadense]